MSVLENDGGPLAAAITCAGLALADAHVPMYDLVAAASIVSFGFSFVYFFFPCRSAAFLNAYLSLSGHCR